MKQEETTWTKGLWQTLKALGRQKKILRPDKNRRLGPLRNGHILLAGKHFNAFEKWTLCSQAHMEKNIVSIVLEIALFWYILDFSIVHFNSI